MQNRVDPSLYAPLNTQCSLTKWKSSESNRNFDKLESSFHVRSHWRIYFELNKTDIDLNRKLRFFLFFRQTRKSIVEIQCSSFHWLSETHGIVRVDLMAALRGLTMTLLGPGRPTKGKTRSKQTPEGVNQLHTCARKCTARFVWFYSFHVLSRHLDFCHNLPILRTLSSLWLVCLTQFHVLFRCLWPLKTMRKGKS